MEVMVLITVSVPEKPLVPVKLLVQRQRRINELT